MFITLTMTALSALACGCSKTPCAELCEKQAAASRAVAPDMSDERRIVSSCMGNYNRMKDAGKQKLNEYARQILDGCGKREGVSWLICFQTMSSAMAEREKAGQKKP